MANKRTSIKDIYYQRPFDKNLQDFLKSLPIEVIEDPNADTDPAKDVKKIDREEEKHGYNPGKKGDEKVWKKNNNVNESEDLSELSKDVLKSYHRKAMEQLAPISKKHRKAETQWTNRVRSGKTLKGYTPKDKLSPEEDKIRKNRTAGGSRAMHRLNVVDGIYDGKKKDSYSSMFKKMNESEDLSELSKKTLGSYIAKVPATNSIDEAKSLVKGINHVGKPVFDKRNGRTGVVQNSYTDGSHSVKWKGEKGATSHDWMETKRHIRIATEKDEHKKYIKESADLSEVSKKTLGNYIAKASDSYADNARKLGRQETSDKPDFDKENKLHKKMMNRMSGIRKASGRLAEENLDEVSNRSSDQVQRIAKLNDLVQRQRRNNERKLKKLKDSHRGSDTYLDPIRYE